jgi:signal peptidase I
MEPETLQPPQEPQAPQAQQAPQAEITAPDPPAAYDRSVPRDYEEKSWQREYLEALLIAVIFATFARTYVVQAFKIPSGSMEQNLLIGDHILVNKFIYGPSALGLEPSLLPVREVRRGDIVVFKFPEDPYRDFIKRCMGLPGDTIEVVDKELKLNGEPVDDGSYTWHVDPFIIPRSPFLQNNRTRDNFGPYTVPAGHYFCMGDNRDNSNDSRVWGTVPQDLIKGRALIVWWSRGPTLGGASLSAAKEWMQAIRWRRFFSLVQ